MAIDVLQRSSDPGSGAKLSAAAPRAPRRQEYAEGEMKDARTRWREGYGQIRHEAATQRRVGALASALARRRLQGDGEPFWDVLAAADRVASAAMWLVVHQTYAHTVRLDGRALAPDDFKSSPEGHTGGALNMAPAYVGYLTANALTGVTRAWLMGQGHCVAAIDSVNLLVGNMTPAHAERYDVSDAGLTRFVRDFYSHRLRADGCPDSPLGSHVNAHTAGGSRRAATSGVWNPSGFTCRYRASVWWCSSPTEPSRSSAAATGRRAGGARKTRDWSRRS